MKEAFLITLSENLEFRMAEYTFPFIVKYENVENFVVNDFDNIKKFTLNSIINTYMPTIQKEENTEYLAIKLLYEFDKLDTWGVFEKDLKEAIHSLPIKKDMQDYTWGTEYVTRYLKNDIPYKFQKTNDHEIFCKKYILTKRDIALMFTIKYKINKIPVLGNKEETEAALAEYDLLRNLGVEN